MKKTFVFVLLIITGLYSCKQKIGEQAAEILINGESLRDETLTFQPGMSNVIIVRPDWKSISFSKLKCILTKTLPNGNKVEFNNEVNEGDNVKIALGSMTSPPVFSFKAGIVYQTGYGIEITLKRRFLEVFHISLNQGLSNIATSLSIQTLRNTKAGRERLITGNENSVLYNPIYGVETTIGMHLHENILCDRNDLRVLLRINPGASVQQLCYRLHITGPEGVIILKRQVNIEQSDKWQTEDLHPDEWGVGDYSIALYPELEGKVWHEGPKVIYRRRDGDINVISVSPVTPWTLQRDTTRKDIIITDLRQALYKWDDKKHDGWDLIDTKPGSAIFNKQGKVAQPITFTFPLTGTYAVFAQPYSEDGCILQVGKDGLVRVIRDIPAPGYNSMLQFLPLNIESITLENQMIFVEATELTDMPIKLFGFSRETEVSKPKSSGLKKLLIPLLHYVVSMIGLTTFTWGTGVFDYTLTSLKLL